MSGYISLATYQQVHNQTELSYDEQKEKDRQRYKKLIKLVDFYEGNSREVIRACYSLAGPEIFTRYLQVYLQRYSIRNALRLTIANCIAYKRRERCLTPSAKPNGVQ